MVVMSVLVYAGTRRASETEVSLDVDLSGDSATIIRVSQFTARDSHPYIDTITVQGNLGDSVAQWTGPPMIVRLDITSPIDSAASYYCSLDCGTNVYGFGYDPPGIDTTIATFSAAIVDSINNVAGMKDTIQGEDSIANGYVLARWLVAQDGLEGDARGVIRVGADDAGTELAIGDSTLVTIAMVCDSMVAAINAVDSLSHHITASNTGDTAYLITQDTAGMTATVTFGDTCQDTTNQRINYDSWTSDADTFPLLSMNLPGTYSSLYGDIILEASDTTTYSYGTADSGMIVLKAYNSFTDSYQMIDSTKARGLPVTLHVATPALRDSVGGTDPDTLWREDLRVIVRVVDSASYPTMSVMNHRVRWSLILR
jgi:hypothetical protein